MSFIVDASSKGIIIVDVGRRTKSGAAEIAERKLDQGLSLQLASFLRRAPSGDRRLLSEVLMHWEAHETWREYSLAESFQSIAGA